MDTEENTVVWEKDDLTVLKEFLLDIDCLDPLAEWTSVFNLFDILKISRVEIRHSNMLSWLLNPKENHGLGDSIIRGFIQYVVTLFPGGLDVIKTLLMDCHDCFIQREWHGIDILAVSQKEQFVFCIENKIDSKEHDNQLNRYRNLIEGAYPGYRKMYIYLSPEGDEPSDPEHWCPMSYQDVLSIIESARKKSNLSPEAQMLIDNYTTTIRRDIVGDEKLARICAEIYAKHQRALDLIFENKPDRAAMLAEIIRSWCAEKQTKGELTFFADKSNKSYTRFTTTAMSEILPNAADATSGWNTANYYFYEIRNPNGKEFYIQLAFSSRDIPDDLREICDRINKYYPSRQQKENWQWRIPFSTKHSKTDEELSEEKIFELLDRKLDEIKEFEARLNVILSSEQ